MDSPWTIMESSTLLGPAWAWTLGILLAGRWTDSMDSAISLVNIVYDYVLTRIQQHAWTLPDLLGPRLYLENCYLRRSIWTSLDNLVSWTLLDLG
eukprot:15326217-Ditylum_brightwellii.AAC.2